MAAACSAALAAAGVSGCGYLADHHVENDATITQQVQALRIDNPAGRVVIHAGDTGGGAAVHRDIDYHGDRPPTPGQSVTAGVLTLTFAAPPSDVTVHSKAGEVTVAVPNGPYAVDASSKAGRRTVSVANDPSAARHVTVSSNAGAVSVTST
jgi:hypothetical protein